MRLNRCKSALFICFVALVSSSYASAQSSDAKALYERGVENNKSGQLIEASVLLTQAIAMNEDYADAYYQRGLSFIGMNRSDKGMKDFHQAIGYKIQNLDPYLRLIKWHNANKKYQATLVVTDQIIANMPENAAGGYWDKGQTYELMNKGKLAIAAYEASLTALGSDNEDFAKILKNRINELKK